MWKCNKGNIKSFGMNNPINVVKLGFLRYAAVQSNGTVIAKGLKLRKYYNPYIPGKPGSGAVPGKIMHDSYRFDAKSKRFVKGSGKYELQLEDPKRLGHFDTVCIWE